MAWYNKYRPSNFTQASGQELVKKVLQNSVKTIFSENPKVKHAYLFSGPRGTGKTSLARIFAKSINCSDQNSVSNQAEACGVCDVCKNGQIDIIELDAASNTGIDNIRDLIEAANTPPFISRYKVYIIDEVHMLSKNAMNALLKTLEEPPAYIVFLMATTDPEKILPTILSRVTHLKLTNHSLSDISKLLSTICTKENVEMDIEAINLISKMAAGGLRDAINLLETVSNYGLQSYNEAEVAEILGVLPTTRLVELAQSLIDTNLNSLKANIEIFEDLGTDPQILLSQLLDHLLSSSLEIYIATGKLENQYYQLIQVLADILSKNLAVSSVKSTLLLVKIRSSDSNQTKLLTPINEPILPVRIENKIQVESVKIQETPEVHGPVSFKNSSSVLSSGENLSTETRSCNFIEIVEAQLKTDKNAPMKIKMFYQNLQAFQDHETIYLYTPSKIAIMPLKSTDVNKWLSELAKNHFGENFVLKIVLEENTEDFKKIKDLIKTSGPNTTVPSTQIAVQQPEPASPVNSSTSQSLSAKQSPTESVQPNETNESFKLSDFYYLYGPLKDGSVPKGMKLLSQKNSTAAEPQAREKPVNNTAQTNHWQDELDDLDLE